MAERPSRPPSPGLVLTVLVAPFLLWMVAEIVVMIGVAQAIGWWTLAIVVATTLIGFVLMGRVGRKSINRLREAAATGIAPDQRAADTGMVITGAILLVLPGLLGNVLGALFVLPFTRPLLTGLWNGLARWAAKRKAARAAEQSPIIPGEVVEEQTDSVDGPLVIEGTVIDDQDSKDAGA